MTKIGSIIDRRIDYNSKGGCSRKPAASQPEKVTQVPPPPPLHERKLTQHQQLQKTHKFVHIQFLIHISTNIYRNNTYNMSF